jgi:hypothetical protein
MAPDTVFCVASLNERWHLALILSERANDKWGTGDVKASMLRLLISFRRSNNPAHRQLFSIVIYLTH